MRAIEEIILMKLRHTIFLAIIATFLAACNFTLAQDVTPPPDYVPPTPVPTLGPLYPASAPDVTNGKTIFVEKCAPCHGDTGLGDGPQGKQLPITVAPIGLASTAQGAIPSAWYTVVTQGNLDRFMPPFASLSDQERWDVISYALTLHTTPDQIEKGKSLFEANCADCAKNFSDLKTMSALAEIDLVKIIKEGKGDIPAFGKNLTDKEATAVAAYIRTLTFAAPLAAPTTAPATEAVATTEAGTPSAETTPLAEGTAQTEVTPGATTVAGMGTVSGSIDNQTGADLPSDTKVTLHGYEHSGDMSAGAQEVTTFEGSVNADGTFAFENIEMPEKRIFTADVAVNGSTYQSGFAVVEPGMTELVLPPITLFASTTDFSKLDLHALQMYFDFATEGKAQIFSVYTITNGTDKTVNVIMKNDKEIPFIAFPEGSQPLGFEATQDTVPFTPTADGFAMPPSEKAYGLIAYASIPNKDEITLSQTALLPIGSVTIYLPEGMIAKGDTLTDDGIQTLQNTNYHVYSASGLKQDESIKFIITGKPPTTAVNPDITQNKTLLISAGVFGIVLILAGAWMFMRDRKSKGVEEVDEEENDDEPEDPESLMDAIIALDDLHRAGKLSDEAYQQRRNELKEELKKIK
jgi:mono/diheme cytochrome c family protein